MQNKVGHKRKRDNDSTQSKHPKNGSDSECSQINQDVLQVIVSYLSVYDLSSIAAVSKEWNSVVTDCAVAKKMREYFKLYSSVTEKYFEGEPKSVSFDEIRKVEEGCQKSIGVWEECKYDSEQISRKPEVTKVKIAFPLEYVALIRKFGGLNMGDECFSPSFYKLDAIDKTYEESTRFQYLEIGCDGEFAVLLLNCNPDSKRFGSLCYWEVNSGSNMDAIFKDGLVWYFKAIQKVAVKEKFKKGASYDENPFMGGSSSNFLYTYLKEMPGGEQVGSDEGEIEWL
ncbi:hypothetical protein AKO1_001434 [Acrasis kona]|uniref:F-box domain-containing protein n=1 Tax=Acrasis kona TaxID=1008807 RepID=A0AAW2YV92_9EUKA